ncbi:MAG: DUF4923 family protein [Prevotella sp.]|nr:DUF4923 family protein [Prevotella sp.]
MKKAIKTLVALAVAATTITSCGQTGLSSLNQLAGTMLTGNGTTTQTAATTTTSNSGSVLGSMLGAVANGNTIGNVLSSVIGLDKVSEQSLVGTWRYSQPGVAFTSENLLAKAGGEVAASTIKNKLATYYNSVGIKSANTYIQFNADHTYSGKLLGTPVSGQWSYNESQSQITMKSLLFTLNPYVKGTTSGISLLFESKKLLTVMQTLASASGNATLQGISSLSTNYDGVRMGFDMSK